MPDDPNPAGGFASVWDRCVLEQFPRIQAGVPHTIKRLAPWRVLNGRDLFFQARLVEAGKHKAGLGRPETRWLSVPSPSGSDESPLP